MEEDVDLELIHEREEAIRKLEVCLVLQYNIFLSRFTTKPFYIYFFLHHTSASF